MQRLGFRFNPSFPPASVVELALELEAGGVDQLWVIEDCFFTSAPPLAGGALGATSDLEVGVGILPAVTRTVALLAMELATLERMGPGRLIGGIGHGVQAWMEQMGVRPSSPLRALQEVLTAVKALLTGQTVDVHGEFVTLEGVVLEPPPPTPPPVLAGVQGPRSIETAGQHADGLVLAEWIGPTYVRWARETARATGPFRVATYSVLCIEDDAITARRKVASQLADQLQQGTPNVTAHPHHRELQARLSSGGVEALVAAPGDWWHEVGAIGTFDDAVAHVAKMHEAGADDVVLLPSSDLAAARLQLQQVLRLAAAIK